ncbi:hypothetical protein [Pandoraea pulmonicola]|uniref:Uncharacterized protein n=1 Tax=Pandoraea pulmonicola TaxID=93221 RepID=A0AAJ5D0K1_PANPU|nr:hypothetical protein [Pandoraea pulmonicola]AJC20674.1 hypothetical protein RO07_09680 [Pandoraea pulmonicola]SUA90831.1 Uncharacterised protein [Pandoraea pulmonicola]
MKTLVFCTSYIRDADAWRQRYHRWLDYYRNGPIKADRLLMIDDGSPWLPSEDLIPTISADSDLAAHDSTHAIVRFDTNLGRQSMSLYPGWWRSFLHSITIARAIDADKIVHLESDAYILSKSLADFINGADAGWHVMWAQRYAMPETAIQVICRDQFDALETFRDEHPDLDFADIAERLLPFTSVNREFKGDRYSEFKRNRGIFRSRRFNVIPIFQWDFFWEPIPDDADFATQVVQRQKVAYRGA